MQVFSVNKFYYNSTVKPSFKANNRWVYDKFSRPLYKTTSYYLRDDLDFGVWADYVHKKYINTQKVHFVNHACSNGMEPLSFVLALLIKHPEDIDKFTPMFAKDINWDNISAALRGSCGVSDFDLSRIKDFTGGKYLNYFNQKPSISGTNAMILEPKPILKDRIIFQQGDMTRDIKNTQQKDVIFAARNVWEYMHPSDQEKFAKDISNCFQDDSATILLGYYDKYGKELLKREGFKELGNYGIFSR